jgi:hypothetical protein
MKIRLIRFEACLTAEIEAIESVLSLVLLTKLCEKRESLLASG